MSQKMSRLELRVDLDFLQKLDDWRNSQSVVATRSEAARTLIQYGLSETQDDQLFSIMKFQILTTALSPGGKDALSDSYVYAWNNGVYPMFHDNDTFHRPFEKHFSITKEMLDELSAHLDETWGSDASPPTFYELEDRYDVRHGKTKWNRMSLSYACRYMYLHEMFDINFWKAVLAPMEHPSEAKGIIRPFKREDLIHIS